MVSPGRPRLHSPGRGGLAAPQQHPVHLHLPLHVRVSRSKHTCVLGAPHSASHPLQGPGCPCPLHRSLPSGVQHTFRDLLGPLGQALQGCLALHPPLHGQPWSPSVWESQEQLLPYHRLPPYKPPQSKLPRSVRSCLAWVTALSRGPWRLGGAPCPCAALLLPAHQRG